MFIALSPAGMERMHCHWSRFCCLAAAWLAISIFPAAFAADVVSIWGGARSTTVLKSDGTVWAWGANFSGKLGIGLDQSSLTNMHVPVEVHGPGDVSFLHPMKAALAGEVHNLAVASDGTVWAWGNSMFGQLGTGTTNASSTPVQVSLLHGVTALGGRGYHSLAIQADGSVWAWGWNSAGELGNGTANATLVPVQVAGLTNPAAVSAGYKYSIALTTNGNVFQWGHGRVIGSSYTPVQTPGLSNIIAISGGWDHALALSSNGTVWSWGQNGFGELGDGTTNNRPTPVQITILSNIVAVSGGDWHSSALAADGTVWKWGRNDTGQLGNGSADGIGNNVPHPVPAKIQFDNYGAPFTGIVMVAARDWHNIAVKADGSVWQWGANDQGQCGDNTTIDRYRPVQVSGLGPRIGRSITLVRTAAGLADLRWQSSAGEYFSVESAPSLANGFSTTLASNILATPPLNALTVPTTNPAAFYRLSF
jgi:alpha-tubulin suppressor-like RCC1 family protein